MEKLTKLWLLASVAALLVLAGCAQPEGTGSSTGMTEDEIENLVRRSYQYVAMYNVIHKNAMLYGAQTNTDGWNLSVADTALKDHTYQAIARPNNDTLYAGALLDLRSEPIIVGYPAFDSKYVVLETSAYDHYCEIPLSTTFGDFKEPTTILYYSARTEGYAGEAIEGVDKTVEMTGDFAIAFVRVMPHAAEPERMQRNLAAMGEITVQTLSQFQGVPAKTIEPVDLPAVGTDFEVFENNFLEVMQFVFNHTTFDSEYEMDRGVLEVLLPLGVAPGQEFDPDTVAKIEGRRFADAARKVADEKMSMMTSGEAARLVLEQFKPKGEMLFEAMLLQSITGPIGLPAHQAVYPAIVTSDGAPMNAQNDYVIRMAPEEMPPAEAFWSVTLYDLENGFFIPNDRKKYSVGENAGMKLDDDGGIEIYIAAERPDGAPEENWLPLNRGDYGIDAIMRIYAPDLERFATWTAPTAEKLTAGAG